MDQARCDLRASSPCAPDYVPRLLRSLGMFEQVAHKPRLNDRAMDLFAKRELAFGWVHMGNSEIEIAQLIDTLHATPFLLPPRAGHLGNWRNMVCGRAGARDYNHVICFAERLGHAFVFDFNQTEADAPGCGDWSFLPGSVVDRCDRRPLKLFSWDGSGFRERDRHEPLFVPLTLTSCEGQLLPLTRFHRNLLQDLGRFRYLSTLFDSHESLVRRILQVLLHEARRQSRPEQMLGRLFDRAVTLEGRLTRMPLAMSGPGFQMGTVAYGTVESFIEHAMLPFRLAARPEEFLATVRELPWQMPIPAISLVQLLKSVLQSHYPETRPVPGALTSPCNPHLHWGGIPMAGYPPQAHGFFRSITKYIRRLFQPVVRDLPEIAPVFNVLLPSAVFNLCPHEAFPSDADCLARLMRRVRRDTAALIGKPDIMSRRVEQIVEAWKTEAEKALSPYIIDRFAPRRGTITSLAAPVEGKLLLLPELRSLTIQQASMVMGALSRTSWRREPNKGGASGQAFRAIE